MSLAPIALFVYNRPIHTLKCLESLAANLLAQQSILFVFSDGPKTGASPEDQQKILEVRKIVRSKKWAGEVHLKEQKKNVGLAKSIVYGVTDICDKYGKIIVLEDDLLVAPNFLTYMNLALERYENCENIYQISGYQFPIKIPNSNKIYLLPLTTTWGWATWARAWKIFSWEPESCKELLQNDKIRKKFDLDGSYYYSSMLESQLDGKIESWGILFGWAVFRKNGLVVYPSQSLINNTGFDGSGQNCGTKAQVYFSFIKSDGNVVFPKNEIIIYGIMKKIKRYLKKETRSSLFSRIMRKIANFAAKNHL